MRATELARTAGLSYRQIDHWVRTGLITARHDLRGPGNPRNFDDDEAHVIRLASALVKAGMAPQSAVPLARQLHQHGHAHLEHGITITTTQEATA